jgi:SAM-dependent methyltransferase/uncharacterized protein YbaR (Trm112 family)
VHISSSFERYSISGICTCSFSPMRSQTIDNLKGEIEFRKKLAQQHTTGEVLLPGYCEKEEHDKILLDRVNMTLRDVEKLEKRGRLSPFIELGAERCQRSLVLTNDFNAKGFSVDISYHQLRTAGHFAQMFNRPKLPVRICCDVNNLPFRDNSFVFAFCYEFLHHFPSPAPVLREVYRILSGGMFFFSEEPFKRPKMILYRQSRKRYLNTALQRSKVIRFIGKFLSEEYCDEREHGIVENSDISLQEWIAALSVFDAREVHVSSLHMWRTRLGDRIAARNLPNMLFGGGISGVCTKDADFGGEPSNLMQLLLCPNCMGKSEHETADPPPLVQTASSLRCSVCESLFPVVDDIIFLLPKNLFRELYPEFACR